MDQHLESENEIQKLKAWCDCVINFILGDKGDPMSTAPRPVYEKAINDAFQEGNIKGLRMVKRDFNDWARHLDLNEQKELDEKLKNQFGEGLASFDKIVAKVLRYKKIKNDDEHSAVRHVLDQLCQIEPSKKASDHDQQVEELDRLLGEYEAKEAAKGPFGKEEG